MNSIESAMTQLLADIMNGKCVVLFSINISVTPPNVECIGFLAGNVTVPSHFVLFNVPAKWKDIIHTTKWRDYFVSAGAVICQASVYQNAIIHYTNNISADNIEIIRPL